VGVVGFFGTDIYRRIEDRFTPGPPAPRGEDPQRQAAGLIDEPALSARRARLFGVPLMVLNGIRALGVERVGSIIGGALGDFVLILSWGWAMANAEAAANDTPSITTENSRRATRSDEVLARQHRARHPDPAQNPV
jgi:hypothetical protein